MHPTLSLEVGSFNILGKPSLYLAFVHPAGYIFWFCLDLVIHSPNVLMCSLDHLIHSLDLLFYSPDLLFLQSGPTFLQSGPPFLQSGPTYLQSRPSFLMSVPLFVKSVPPLSIYCIPIYSSASMFKATYVLMGSILFLKRMSILQSVLWFLCKVVPVTYHPYKTLHIQSFLTAPPYKQTRPL